MKRQNKKAKITMSERQCIEKVKIILRGRDDVRKAVESAIDVLFEQTIKDLKHSKYYF